MNAAIQALWQYLDDHRGDAPVEELLVRALATEPGIQVTSDMLDAISKRMGSRFATSYLSSANVARFIAEIAGARDAKSILDPVCGSGLLLKLTADATQATVVHGVEINESVAQVAVRLLGEDGKVFVADVLRDGLPLQKEYDLIVAEPPLGGPRPEPLDLGEPAGQVRGDFTDLLAAWVCGRLSENGVGVVILPPGFFWSRRSMQARDAIQALGGAVAAAVQLPSGSLQGTSMEAYIVVLERGEQGQIFVGQYSSDVSHQRVLLDNLTSRREGRRPAQGRLCLWEGFRGYGAIEASDRVQRLVSRLGYEPIAMSELIVSAQRTNRRDFSRLEPAANSVYLPLTGRGRVTATQDDLSDRLKDYAQLQLDPEQADARFVSNLLNGELGQALLDTIQVGAVIPRVRLEDLVASVLYLPPLDAQRVVLGTLDRIAAIRAELDELEDALWVDATRVEQVARQVEGVNREDSLDSWVDTLPFPLAIILWRYHAEAQTSKEKYEILLHYFEALAEFLATVHLSAFSSHPEIWVGQRQRLAQALEKQHLTLQLSTFGAWKCIAEFLGARCRETVRSDPAVCENLYRTHSRETLQMLASTEIVRTLQRANSLRNEWHGHAGAIGHDQADALHAELLSLLQQSRAAQGRLWLNYELLLPEESRFRDGIFRYRAKRIMGTRSSPFETVERESVEQMDDRFLYLFDSSSDRGLQLLPFVKMLRSPESAQNACYFYNRVQGQRCRFISYHFDKDSALEDAFAETLEAIDKLHLESSSTLLGEER